MISMIQFQNFIQWFLTAIANFLGSEPVVYIVYLLMALIVIKLFVSLMHIFR